MSTSTSTCPILMGASNFALWRIRIVEKLCTEKVYSCISGDDANLNLVSNPTASVIYPLISAVRSPSSFYNLWHVCDGKAHGIITQHLNDHDVLTYTSSPTSKELFDRIACKYEGTNIGVNAFYMFATMMGHKYTDGMPIDNHISTLASDSQKLILMNKTFNDKFLAFLLLYSLPLTPSWETFESSVLNSLPTNAKLSFENVSNHLLAEVTHTKGDLAAIGTIKLAMKASKWCNLHKTSTHSNEECHTQKQKQRRSLGRRRIGSCQRRKGGKRHIRLTVTLVLPLNLSCHLVQTWIMGINLKLILPRPLRLATLILNMSMYLKP